MKYSIWNPESSTYSVYESGANRAIMARPVNSGIGAVPFQSMSTLPAGSKYLGESLHAQGEIVRKSISVSNFIFMALTLITARFIYDRFIA